MSRRSSRLLSIGYYNSDENFDPNISYHENPVKVFKRKTGYKRGITNAAKNDASSSTDAPVHPTANGQSNNLRRALNVFPTNRTGNGSAQPPTMPLDKFPGHYSNARPEQHLRPEYIQVDPSRVDATCFLASDSLYRRTVESPKKKLSGGNGLADNGQPTSRVAAMTSKMVWVYRLALLVTMGIGLWVAVPHAKIGMSLLKSGNPLNILNNNASVVDEEKMKILLLPLEQEIIRLVQMFQDYHNNSSSDAAILKTRILSLEELLRTLRQGKFENWNIADQMPDFALETQGATVVTSKCSKTYQSSPACLTLFGIALWDPCETPRTVIQGHPVLAGKCWAFPGSDGTLVVQLSHPVRISHVTLDHLVRHKSPTGRIDSAPKDFEVYGMHNDSDEGLLLGTFTYNENGPSTQTFWVPDPVGDIYKVVKLHILNNWNNPDYTCLYRFRVHGQMPST